MIRLAVITTGFSKDKTDYGGASSIHNFIKELSLNSEIQITVFALYYPLNGEPYNFYNVKVYPFGNSRQNSKLDKYKIWKRCKEKFTEEHSKNKFDLIQSLWAGESGYVASKLSKKLNIPLISTICGGELAGIKEINYGSQLKFWQKYFIKKTFEQSHSIVCLSDYIADKVKSVYGSKYEPKLKILPFGVDEKIFFPDNKPSSKKLINIANAVPVKSQTDLFKAFKIVLGKFPDFILECYGRDDNNYLMEIASELGLQNNVHLNGFIDYEKIPEALNTADCFVLSSLYEAQNTSIIEAAFCGLPIVSTKVGCAEDVTEHLVEPGNYLSLAKKIKYVLENLESEKEKSKVKLPALLAKYSLNTSSQRFIGLYRSVLSH